jgi:hypothetical protein
VEHESLLTRESQAQSLTARIEEGKFTGVTRWSPQTTEP